MMAMTPRGRRWTVSRCPHSHSGRWPRGTRRGRSSECAWRSRNAQASASGSTSPPSTSSGGLPRSRATAAHRASQRATSSRRKARTRSSRARSGTCAQAGWPARARSTRAATVAPGVVTAVIPVILSPLGLRGRLMTAQAASGPEARLELGVFSSGQRDRLLIAVRAVQPEDVDNIFRRVPPLDGRAVRTDRGERAVEGRLSLLTPAPVSRLHRLGVNPYSRSLRPVRDGQLDFVIVLASPPPQHAAEPLDRPGLTDHRLAGMDQPPPQAVVLCPP